MEDFRKLTEETSEIMSEKSDDMFVTEITFLASGINSELNGLTNSNAKKIGNMVYDALLKIRDGDIDGARKLFKKVV